jgi:uncharacterized protein
MLDSYYEIEQDGRKYFGNVSLKEFHQFQRDGESYLFNVATMKPHRISEPAARLVDKASASYGGGLLSEQVMDELKRLDLVAGIDSPSAAAPAPDSAKATAGAAKARYGIGSIALFVAQKCNMACVYCYGQGGEYSEGGMMSTATAFKAVDWLMENCGDLESVNVGFFGGEPTMNFPLIRKVVKYAKQAAQGRGKKVTFGMTTNASLLSDERIAFLREENVHCMVSFDGPPEIQNRQRPFKTGKGSYNKVRANVQKLIKIFPQTPAHAVLHGDTDPAEVRAGMEQAGFRSFSMLKSSPVILDGPAGKDAPGPDRAGQRKLAMEESLARELLRDIKARAVGVEATNSTVGFFVGQLISSEKRHYYCGVGRGMAAVTAGGDLYPCHRFAGQQDMKLGTLESYRVDGINDYHRAIVDRLPECQRCWARYACGGGCFYQNKAVRGDIHLPDRSSCLEVKEMMEMAIPLYLQLDEEDRAYVKESLKRQLEDRIP